MLCARALILRRIIHGQIHRNPSVRSDPRYSPNKVMTAAWLGWIMKNPAETNARPRNEPIMLTTNSIFMAFGAPSTGTMLETIQTAKNTNASMTSSNM